MYCRLITLLSVDFDSESSLPPSCCRLEIIQLLIQVSRKPDFLLLLWLLLDYTSYNLGICPVKTGSRIDRFYSQSTAAKEICKTAFAAVVVNNATKTHIISSLGYSPVFLVDNMVITIGSIR